MTAALAEREFLRARELVPAAGAPATNRDVVADQYAVAFGENRWSIGQARSVLLPVVGGVRSHPAVVWNPLGQDPGGILTGWGRRPLTVRNRRRPAARGREEIEGVE
jgi:hypothetical protein